MECGEKKNLTGLLLNMCDIMDDRNQESANVVLSITLLLHCMCKFRVMTARYPLLNKKI